MIYSIYIYIYMQGKISREEVAQICVAALESPYASGKTFEVTARLMSLNCVLCAVAVIFYFWKLKAFADSEMLINSFAG